ncbi:hypothetical protein B0H67DRAFT_336833 [Lasiosphaeris hirsuta]|uniref:Uncharacterized protein n=1 Tax=Lasiosphaeris hirsuta TaxID=260670 RepID=A0AA40A2Y8_9PEZI|nr:hypothetical protein B0H67DRAFT_336833 [Lasiosphaeris hirsuta]
MCSLPPPLRWNARACGNRSVGSPGRGRSEGEAKARVRSQKTAPDETHRHRQNPPPLRPKRRNARNQSYLSWVLSPSQQQCAQRGRNSPPKKPEESSVHVPRPRAHVPTSRASVLPVGAGGWCGVWCGKKKKPGRPGRAGVNPPPPVLPVQLHYNKRYYASILFRWRVVGVGRESHLDSAKWGGEGGGGRDTHFLAAADQRKKIDKKRSVFLVVEDFALWWRPPAGPLSRTDQPQNNTPQQNHTHFI